MIFNNIHDKEIPFSDYAIRKQKVFNFLTDNKVKILQKKIKFDFLADTNKTHYNFKFKLDSKGFSTNVLLDSKWGWCGLTLILSVTHASAYCTHTLKLHSNADDIIEQRRK